LVRLCNLTFSIAQEDQRTVWNKNQPEPQSATPEPTPAPPPASSPNPSPPRAERQAILGPSIKIKGSLSGEEDLLIEGHVEGEVSFKRHAVTVGKRGKVDADLYCKSIFVEGEVHGNLYGEELVVVRKSANVSGNAVAPRVSLEDGSQFHGAIDMQPKQVESTPQPRPANPPQKKPEAPQQQKNSGPGTPAQR
jgi:cytoskeletal protein CcmA (bactofilin family)